LTKSRDFPLPEDVLQAKSFDKVLEMARNEELKNIFETIFVIGGQQVYEEALKYPECQKLYVTHIHNTFDCDTVFPPFEDAFESVRVFQDKKEDGGTYHFEEYERKKTSDS